MEESYVIKGLTRQAKMAGLPQPYFMAVGALTVIPFMIIKNPLLLGAFVIWYTIARSIAAVNPYGHRIVLARLRFLPTLLFGKAVRFKRSRKGLIAND